MPSTIEVYIGQVSFFAFGWVPPGWVLCNGQMLPDTSTQNPYNALFSLLQYQFGGSSTLKQFAVPDLRGRCIIGPSSTIPFGTMQGHDMLALTPANIPPHHHTLTTFNIPCSSAPADQSVPTGTTVLANAPANIYSGFASINQYGPLQNVNVGNTGLGNPISLMNPYVAMMPCISYQGEYPSFGQSN